MELEQESITINTLAQSNQELTAKLLTDLTYVGDGLQLFLDADLKIFVCYIEDNYQGYFSLSLCSFEDLLGVCDVPTIIAMMNHISSLFPGVYDEA